MKSGYLYFIKDSFYEDYPHKDLKPNKSADKDGNVHNRPCYYAFSEDNIVWMIPVSSQVKKYEKIYKNKTKDGKDCDTIVFGYVKGNKNAFLIQNMIPVTEEYINNIYIDKSTDKPVTLSVNLKRELNAKARKVLRLTRNNIAKIVFTPIMEIEKKLQTSISLKEKVAATSEIIEEVSENGDVAKISN